MSKDKSKKVKFATVFPAKVCLIVMWGCFAVLMVIGLVILLAFNNKELAAGFFAFAVGVFLPISVIMHIFKAGNTVTFVDDKIMGRRKTLTWDTAYLTIHCHKFLGSRTTFVWLYFDDHYLTEKEVRSMRVARQGLYLRLNIDEANFIYPHLKRSVKILDYCNGFIDGSEAMYILGSYDSIK